MTYSVVPTVNTGDAWTAAMHNQYIRDNFAAGVPDIFSAEGDLAYATGADAATRLGLGSLGAVLVAGDTAPRWSSSGVTASSAAAVNVWLRNTLTAVDNSDSLHQLLVHGVFAKSTYTGLAAFGVAVVGSAWTASGAGTIAAAFGVYVSTPTIGTANWSLYVASGNSVIAGGVDDTTSGIAYIGDNANANMTTGLTINQRAAANEIISLKSSTIAHGVTSLTETDTFGYFSKNGSDSGGLGVVGIRESQSPYSAALMLVAVQTSEDTTKSTAGHGAVEITAYTKSGTGTTTAGANTNLLSITNGGTTRFLFDAEGDSHQDVGTSWSNFDSHNDAELLTALSVHVSRPGDPIKSDFRQFLKKNKRKLEALKLVTFNKDGHHFVNMSRLTMLLVGAVRQQAAKLDAILSRVDTLERLIGE